MRLENSEFAMDHRNENHYLRAPSAAAYLGLSPSTLAKMRLRGDGPVYRKCGRRIVVYAVSDLDSFLAQRRRRSTSDEGGET
jgi:predicted DNA-binding transcriptional regulator AlpA